MMLLKRSLDTISQSLNENECIVLHVKKGEYFGLEEALKEVWMLIDDTTPLEKERLFQLLCQKFDNQSDEIKQLVDDSLNQLIELELVMVVPDE